MICRDGNQDNLEIKVIWKFSLQSTIAFHGALEITDVTFHKDWSLQEHVIYKRFFMGVETIKYALYMIHVGISCPENVNVINMYNRGMINCWTLQIST